MWLKLPPFYRWTTTATNAWGVEMEQQYADGRYRHRTFDDYCRPTGWVDGPHPIAQELRDAGKEETDSYRRLKRYDASTI